MDNDTTRERELREQLEELADRQEQTRQALYEIESARPPYIPPGTVGGIERNLADIVSTCQILCGLDPESSTANRDIARLVRTVDGAACGIAEKLTDAFDCEFDYL